MKLWFLTTEYPPFHGGGIATYMQGITQLWAEHGEELTIFLYDASQTNSEEPRLSQEMPNIRLQVVRDDTLDVMYRQALGLPARIAYVMAQAVLRYIERHGPPDVIECQDYQGVGYFLLQEKKALNPWLQAVPIIVVAHGPQFIIESTEQVARYRLPEFWTGEMERFCYRAADAVVVPGQHMADLVQREYPEIHTILIPHPVWPKTAVTERAIVEPESWVYVGRIQLTKGILPLIEAFRRLWTEGFTVPLDIVGEDMPYHAKGMTVQQYLVQRYGTYREAGLLRFHGKLPPDQVNHLLARAYGCVLPSQFESFSYVMAEALSLGIPTVTMRTGVAQDIIRDHDNGFVVADQDPQHWADTIEAVTQTPPELRRQVGERGRQALQHWTDPEQNWNQRRTFLRSLQNLVPGRDYPFIRLHPRPREQHAQAERRPLISVVIPFYNMGETIGETMETLMAALEPLASPEVIIVDDGSTDANSVAALTQVQADYPQVRIEHIVNQGLAHARNWGAERATGEFLAFLDADDQVDPRYYPWAMQLLQYYRNVSFVGCWVQYFGAIKQIWPTWNPEPPYILYHNTVNSSALVYRRADFMQYGQNSVALQYGMEDYESVIQMIGAGCGGIIIPRPLFYYRIRPDSMFRQMTPQTHLYSMQLITERHATLFQQFSHDLINMWNANGPQYFRDNPTWAHGALPDAPMDSPPQHVLWLRERLVQSPLGMFILRIRRFMPSLIRRPLRQAAKTVILRTLGQRPN